MLNLEGFTAITKKSPNCYGLKYGTKRLASGSTEYRFLFSQSTMEDQGWACGDYISIAYAPDHDVLGFAKCEVGAPYARKLRRKDTSRTGCMIAVQGDSGLPELKHNTELEIVTGEFEPCEASLLAQFPDWVE